MAKKKMGLKIEKQKFVVITSAELDAFMAENRFSDKDKTVIKETKETYANACLVLYFLNFFNSRYVLDSFMPIYNERISFEQSPAYAADRVLCTGPWFIRIDIDNWRREQIEPAIRRAVKKANWQGDFGFGIQEDEMPTRVIDISPAVGKPVSQADIQFMFEQLDAYKKKAAARPEFMPYVREIVKDIELLRREYDVQLGFTADLIAAHDFAIELPMVDGKAMLAFDGDCFLSVINFFKTCIQKILPGSGGDSVLSPAAFAYGSTVLLLDIVQTNKEINPKHEEKAKENVENAKQTVKKIVGASQGLIGKGDPDKKLDAFFKETQIDPVKAAPIVEKLEKVFPSSKSKYNEVKILVPGVKSKPIILKKAEYLSFVGLSAQLKEQIKVPPKEVLEGFLGAVAVWDKEDPRFTIKTEDKKRPTIHYTHSDKNDEKVRSSIGKPVKVRVSYEGGKTYLTNWL